MSNLEEQSVKRARQAWRLEEKYEKELTQEYELLLENISHEISDLFARYSTDGIVDYNKLRTSLDAQELSLYRRKIENIIAQNRNIDDEDILIELEKLLNYRRISVIDSKRNTIEAHTLVTIHNGIEIVSESLTETQEYVESHTNYDIQKETGIGRPVNKLTGVALTAFLLDDSFTGLTYPEAIKESRHRLVRDIQKGIVSGVKRKETFPRLSKWLEKEVMGGKGLNSIHSTLRGETTRVISETALNTYEEAGLDKYQFVATLDDRTSEICQSMDGTIHKVEDAEEGVNLPKMHFNCRSTIAPYIDKDDLSEVKRKARSPETGQNYEVPGNISYKEWDKKYNK